LQWGSGAMAIDRISIVLQQQRQRRRSFATGQRQWGNRSNCNSNGALGKSNRSNRRQGQGGKGATALLSLPLRCGRGAWGAGVGVVYSVFYSEKLVNGKRRSE
jgi:hypothetical protein